MITDKQIKTFIAPQIKNLRAMGFKVMYNACEEVVLSNEKYGIKLSANSYLGGKYEYWLSPELIYLQASPPVSLDDLLSRFTVILSVKEIQEILK